MASFRGENVYPTNIKTARIPYTVTSNDVSNGDAAIAWTISPPFPDNKYTASMTVESITGSTQNVYPECVTISGNTVTAYVGVYNAGDTIIVHFMAIHDFGLLP